MPSSNGDEYTAVRESAPGAFNNVKKSSAGMKTVRSSPALMSTSVESFSAKSMRKSKVSDFVLICILFKPYSASL